MSHISPNCHDCKNANVQLYFVLISALVIDASNLAANRKTIANPKAEVKIAGNLGR